MFRIRSAYLAYACTGVIGVSLWEAASRSSQGVRLLVSSPSLVACFIAEEAHGLLTATLVTGVEAALGLVLAISTSMALILATYSFPRILALLMPVMVASQAIPLIVLAPFFVMALGIGISSKIAMAAVLCFFPIYVGLAQGYRLIPQEFHDLLDVYHAPRRSRISLVFLPLSLPSAMAGLKVSATLSVIGAIVAEFTGSEQGLGRNLFLSTVRLEPELMIASLLGATALGISMYTSIHLLERRIGFWYLPRTEE